MMKPWMKRVTIPSPGMKGPSPFKCLAAGLFGVGFWVKHNKMRGIAGVAALPLVALILACELHPLLAFAPIAPKLFGLGQRHNGNNHAKLASATTLSSTSFLARGGRVPAALSLGARPERAALPALRCSAENDWRAEEPVVVVGAGVAGMSAAIQLAEKGIPVKIIEAGDGVGGRVRTDNVDGFLCDRGFQIFLTSYPEAQRLLDYEQLALKPFYAGGNVRWNGGFHLVSDPFRHPVDAVGTLLPWHPIGSIVDKILVGILRLQSLIGPLDDLWRRPDEKIADRLAADVFFGAGFSKEMIDRFFRPFLGGIFFDNKLRTTARELDFTFRMLALGQNCLPEKGIGAVADYMAGLLPEDSIRLNSPVKSVSKDGSSVTLVNGETIKAGAVVVATEGDVARKLLATASVDLPEDSEPKKTMCLYYSIDGDAPVKDPILYLNGDGVIDAEGTCTVNNMCFPSTVAPSYAPQGKSLASVSLIGIPKESDAEVSTKVKEQLKGWFGASVDDWELLKTYRIEYCQPNQEPPTSRDDEQEVSPFLYVAGDHTDSASLNGALRSGTRCAELVSSAMVPLLLKRGQKVVDEYAKKAGTDSIAP